MYTSNLGGINTKGNFIFHAVLEVSYILVPLFPDFLQDLYVQFELTHYLALHLLSTLVSQSVSR